MTNCVCYEFIGLLNELVQKQSSLSKNSDSFWRAKNYNCLSLWKDWHGNEIQKFTMISLILSILRIFNLQKLYINGLRFRGIRNILDRNRTVGLKQYALKIVDPKEVEEKTVENLDLFAKEVRKLSCWCMVFLFSPENKSKVR